ncbi:hypothetical protein JSQ73_003660 [Wolbachia endosymbiont of Anopheles demeilloni]|uniref:hypothetical protein n=1 Tax=Wolbachia endosymbiont of Anopheles demeilloni TaxID=2748871 RepID=UPI001F27B392|nr:hypothetical protein [Wolbachia endosymbiont of Anopheles demeilloni]UIP92282.1 hypothetical protein JSQ73_003660 [Wolbachia endosymbiont of Anopheles demeilloni]
MLFALGIATSIGALTGLALSFTTLSPLVMGGIVASVLAALFTCIMIYNKNFSKKSFIIGACLCAASFATRVSLVAAATAVFPGAMLGMESAALAGELIAPISVIAGLIATACIIKPIAKKVNEYIISPIVEKCFSSKEEKTG